MLDSVAVHYRVIVWPLLGAATILALNRFLPNWLRRVVALAAAITSLVSLWTLTAGESTRVEIFWDPLNFFRVSPSLLPDSTTRFFGTVLIGMSAAAVLGIRGSRPRRSIWHGLILLALSACLGMTMAANLLTLTLGSAMLDLALLAVVVSAASRPGRVAWRTAVPGILSTLLLFVASLQMDIEIGTTSLLTAQIPASVLTFMAAAGLLRLSIFPLHPRGLNAPEDAAMLILPTGVGIYLLYRVAAHGHALGDHQWILAIGCLSLLIGGALVWIARSGSPTANAQPGLGREVPGEPRSVEKTELEGQLSSSMSTIWTGLAIHQTALALIYGVLLGAAVPWPLINLSIALVILAIWWDSQQRAQVAPSLAPSGPVKRWVERSLNRVKSSVSTRLPATEGWPVIRLARHYTALPPLVALVSLVGMPATAGALGRWRLYATLLNDGRALLLIGTLVADVLLCAGLWWVLGIILEATRTPGPRVAPFLITTALAALSVVLGIIPARLVGDLGTGAVRAARSPNASLWGVGLLFVLPWLLGSWLAHTRIQFGSRSFRTLLSVLRLDWAFSASSWAAQRLANLVHWLGQVGEGEGWWGWALVVLTLGTMFLANL